MDKPCKYIITCPYLHETDITVNGKIVNKPIGDYYTSVLVEKIKQKNVEKAKLLGDITKLVCNVCKSEGKKKIILECKKHFICEGCYKRGGSCNKCN
jgi:hypothetical protein